MEVLDHAFDSVDYISIHNYYGKGNEGTAGFLGWADHMDRFIHETILSPGMPVAAQAWPLATALD